MMSPVAQEARSPSGCVDVSQRMETFAKFVFEKDLHYSMLIGKELSALSVDEREKIYETLHGVDIPIMETPDFVAQKLDELNSAIDKIWLKPAYDLAEQKDHTYVRNKNFRLMFLRADLFDASKAASRMVNFFKSKLRLFGEATINRPVYFSDLDKGTQDCVRSGICQVIPARDRSGRAILAIFDRMIPTPYKNSMEMVRTVAYTSMTLMEDDRTQRNGVIALLYFIGPHPMNCDIKLNSDASQTLEWLPARLCAQHFCSDNRVIKALKNLLILSWIKEVRTRLRVHNGTNTECQYALLSYGIPITSLPVSYDGSLKVASHAAWLKKQLVRDATLKSTNHDSWGFGGIDLPFNTDVLIGKGKICQEHPGNIAMRRVCEEYLDDYMNANSKKEKTEITRKTVDEIKVKGGRFLERDSDGWWWEVTDNDKAREKISMLFRTMAHKDKGDKQNGGATGGSRSKGCSIAFSSPTSEGASSEEVTVSAKRTKTSIN